MIAEAKANPKPQKLTQFGDLILYLLIVIIISFIMIGLALINLLLCFINSCAFIYPLRQNFNLHFTGSRTGNDRISLSDRLFQTNKGGSMLLVVLKR